MIKELAWKTFKKTGNIDTFLELKQLEDCEKLGLQINKKQEEKIQEENFNK